MYKRITCDQKTTTMGSKVIIIGKVKSINEDELKLQTDSDNLINVSFEDKKENYKVGSFYEFRGEFLTEDMFNSHEAILFNKEFKLKLYNESVRRLNAVLNC